MDGPIAMANSNPASETDVGLQGFLARAIASGIPLAAAVYVASGHLWVGVTVAVAVAITGALVRKLAKPSGSGQPALPAE